MKILAIAPRIPEPLYDGGAVYVFDTLKALARKGHDITLACFKSNLHPQSTQNLSTFCHVHTIPGNFKPYTLLTGVKSMFIQEPVTIYHRMDRHLMGKLLDGINQSFDIILLEGLHTAAFIELVRNKFPDTGIILRESNVEFQLLASRSQNGSNILKKIYLNHQTAKMRKFERDSLQKVDGFTAISPADLKILAGMAGDTPGTVSLPMISLPELKAEKDPRLMLIVGSWKWEPNLDGLVWFMNTCWKPLYHKYPDLKLVVAGPGLPEKFKTGFFTNNVSFPGFVDDLETLRQQASIFVSPVFKGSGIRIKILEALASGCCVVTTELGVLGLDVEAEKQYLKAANKKEFTDQIDRIIQGEISMDNIAEHARRYVRDNHSFARVSKKLEKFLQTF